MEIWKDIKGYEGKYSVSNEGRIKRLQFTHKTRNRFGDIERTVKEKEIFLSKSKDKKHLYLTASLWNLGKVKTFGVHRLVAIAFIDNPENKKHVNHLDGNPLNNNVDNLQWATPSENEKYSYTNLGKIPWNKGKKLSEDRADIYKKAWITKRNNLLLKEKGRIQ